MTKWYESLHIRYKINYIWNLFHENLWAKIYEEQTFSVTRLYSFYGLCLIYDVIFGNYFTYFVSVIWIPSILYRKKDIWQMIYTAVAYEYVQKSVSVMKVIIILLIGYLWTCNASDT